ncbi:hypothetical protein BMI86_10205 [Thioclava sp. DLFJ5-1]|uniref:hypothetical protein n=1 Tax=Thioclava sp. DLFJ5-1 TaxID=1915314 RepID=UPI000996F904|nr:hypothetical protein [Thioclava sp. DLFJ5-1]OOY20869.1 hypothetical protein BMI86_10205 [Thioclava sp. DLFJ5-1]
MRNCKKLETDPVAAAELEPGTRPKPGSELANKRRAWMIEQKAKGYSILGIGRALGISHGSVMSAIAVAGRGGPKRQGGSKEAAASNRARFRVSRESPKNGHQYADLHAQGLTATVAARMRGEAPQTARRWAEDHGLEWADGWKRKTPEHRERGAAMLNSPEVIQRRAEAMRRRAADPTVSRLANLTPAEREVYDLCRAKHLSPSESARIAGRPDLTLEAWERRQKLEAALANASPEEIMLARARVRAERQQEEAHRSA